MYSRMTVCAFQVAGTDGQDLSQFELPVHRICAYPQVLHAKIQSSRSSTETLFGVRT